MKRKITIRFMIISAAAIIITAAVSAFLFYHVLSKQIFSDLKGYADLIQLLNMDQLNVTNKDIRVTLINEDGTVFYDNVAVASKMENHNNRPEVIQAKKSGEGNAIRYSHTTRKHTFYYARLMPDNQVLRISTTTHSLFVTMENTMLIILVISILTFIASALVAHLLTRKMVEPIERMAENILVLETEDVYDEIRPFVNTIKEQHMNLLNHGKIRQEFTANVSHELKTPLTSISGYAELIENGMANEEDSKRFAFQIQKNAKRLLNLINDIIKLSELDDSNLEVQFEKVNLLQLAESCISMMELNAEKMEVTLQLKGEPLAVRGNRMMLEELICNLCSNAIRYNNRGGSVTISVTEPESKDEILLTVEDTGIGIPKEDQERVFERFYRVDKSRSKLTGGTGLGLAIVKHIVAQHEASITMESQLHHGTKIMIHFKKSV